LIQKLKNGKEILVTDPDDLGLLIAITRKQNGHASPRKAEQSKLGQDLLAKTGGRVTLGLLLPEAEEEWSVVFPNRQVTGEKVTLVLAEPREAHVEKIDYGSSILLKATDLTPQSE